MISLVAGLLAIAPGLVPIEDHRDQWGLMLSVGTAVDTAVNPSSVKDYHPGFLPMIEVGGTLAITDLGDELSLRVRLVDLENIGPQFLFGYRGYFGQDEFKTFFQADLFVTTAPFWGVGAHAGLGAQYDFDRTWGIFAQVGFGATFGANIFAAFDGSAGGQVRF